MRQRFREDKDETARCPFCKESLRIPEPLRTELGECLGGRCGCGTVYCFDPTGHNIGEAYLDALSLAFGQGWNTMSEGQYEEAVLHYNARSHRLFPIKEIRRMDTPGAMVFIRRAEKKD